MKFYKTYIGLALLTFSSSSNADNSYYYKIDQRLTSGSVVIKDGDTELPPEVGCDGNELTRLELDALIANGADVTKACVGTITNFSWLFNGNKTFNQDISGWDVSSGTNFSHMFQLTKVFNQNISNWDVSSGTDFQSMFGWTESFNQDISKWDVSKGVSFYQMFQSSVKFNQDISGWDFSNGIDLGQMFTDAKAFDQNISGWDVSKAISWKRFSLRSNLTKTKIPPRFINGQ